MHALLVPRNGFLLILACFVRYSWTYDTERVKLVIGLMGAQIFFIYPTVPTVLYPTAKASNQEELNCGTKKSFSEIADSTIGFSAKFSTFYVLGPSSEN